jgi:hypothetical protein
MGNNKTCTYSSKLVEMGRYRRVPGENKEKASAKNSKKENTNAAT